MELLSPDYHLDTHFVQTKDGYFLTLFRLIPNSSVSVSNEPKISPKVNSRGDLESLENDSIGIKTPSDPEPEPNTGDKEQIHETKSKGPVLLVHGFMCSGDEWFANNSDSGALPYVLAREGYDCWIGCQRGSRLTGAEPHVKYSYKDAKFWDFSIDEMGQYDIPAMIDHVLEKTQYSNLHYVGHSLGCTALYICCSSKPEYNAKVKVMASLTPATCGDHNNNFLLIKLLLPFGLLFGHMKCLYRRPVFGKPASKSMNAFWPCLPKKTKESLTIWVWTKASRALGVVGKKSEEQLEERIPDLITRFPGRTSLKAGCHAFQIRSCHKFRWYNHGRSENMRRYGQPTPPEYDLKKVSLPVAVFTSEYDKLIFAQDVLSDSQKLPNLIYYKELKEPKFSHVDFMLGKHAQKYVYEEIITIFNKY